MRAAPIPSARKATPVSPIPARTTATRKDPRRRAISRRGGTVSTKMTRNPSARRKTTTPYRPAAARSGRAAISRPMAALAIILWRALQHMPNVDGFAPSEILHFPPSEPSRPDGTDFAVVSHRNFVAGPDLARRVSDSDREDVAYREEVLDLDPIGVLLGQDFAPRQGQGKHAARGVHRELMASSEHPDIGKTPSERGPFDEAQPGVAELEAGEVRHLLREARARGGRPGTEGGSGSSSRACARNRGGGAGPVRTAASDTDHGFDGGSGRSPAGGGIRGSTRASLHPPRPCTVPPNRTREGPDGGPPPCSTERSRAGVRRAPGAGRARGGSGRAGPRGGGRDRCGPAGPPPSCTRDIHTPRDLLPTPAPLHPRCGRGLGRCRASSGSSRRRRCRRTRGWRRSKGSRVRSPR